MTYTTTNELRNTLTLSLGILGLEESLITQLLSDDFINGAFELTQNIPENDEFMNFVRNFSEEQSLKSLINAQNEITEEFCTEGHFTSICQYVIDAWRNINFSVNVQPMSSNNENEQEENNSPKPIAILNTILDIAGFVPSLKPIVEETRIYEKIAIAVHNQDKKIYDIAEQFDQELWAIATGARKSFTTAENQASPLVIDLDGDGVETTDTQNGIYFDHDDNGFAENSSWVGKDDGLLVRDLNNNGQIDNGTELFGNNSVLSSGEKAANGFEALADLDSNNDGIFNSSDTAWNEVKVWKDVNSNGEVDEGELLTLEQANIVGINLDYQNSGTVDENGNPHKQTGTFTKTDGSTGSVHDVWFDADYANTIDTTEVEISETIAALPNIQGFGNMHDLHTAMALDTSGELKTLIEQYIAETDPVARRGMIDNIIFHWAGVEDIDPLSRKPSYFYDNPIGDARYLEVLERFLGQKYSNRWWFGQEEQNPHEQASQHLLQGYDILATYVSNELEAQTHCKTLLENIKLTWNSTTQVWDVDVSGAVNILNSLASENISATVQVIYNLEDIIKQQNIMSDEIIAVFQTSTSTVEALQMYLTNFGKLENRITAGDDIINGSENDDNINALSGNDKIYGESGNDILAGGAGDDYLVGGSGSDTYFFEGSWGHDSIDNSNTDEKGTNPDKILFGEGINPSDVTIQRRGNDLILSLHNGADTITVYSYFLEAGTTTNTIDTIEFANGTVWDYDDVRGAWNSAPVSIGGFATISGTNDNDTINGTSGTDFLSGEKGNDVINANAGNDVIYGGAGNDTLRGAGGNDVYIWNWGDGLDTIYDTGNDDTISFGIGITPEMLKFSCVNEYDLKIIVNGNESQGSIINDFFSTNLNYKIEKIQFYAGQSMLLSEVGLKLEQSDEAEIINGTPHNDTVFANGGHDTVNAGTGDDTVYGGRGDDVLNGNTGNDTLSGDAGFDSLYGESGDDVLSGGSGNDYLVGGAGDDTYLYHIGDGLETIYDYVNSTTDSKNDKIKFGEGITPNDITFTKKGEDLAIVLFDDITQGIVIQDFFYNSYYQIEKLEFADGTIMDLTADLIFEYSDGNDIVSGTANNDIIYGQGGDDELTGNNGNDTLIGGEGDDTLYGGNGDDTYIWNLGDGLDYISDYYNNNTIKFGEGITLENLTFERGNLNNSSDDDNLYIFVNGNRNQGIKINSFFFNASNFTLQFADGTTFVPKDNGFNYTLPENQTELQGSAYADTLTGNNYDNELTGNGGDDILAGGKGNDGLNGGNGDDTYVWNLGDGLDSIYDYYNNNTIKFGEGITLEDLTFERGNLLNNSSDEDNLYIFVNGDRSQGIKINSFFFNGPNFTLKFTDGTTFVPKDNGFNYTLPENQTELQGSGYADTLSGNDYDNELDGNGGDDILAGGKGNDGLNGGNGDDIYVWNLGDGLDSIYDYYNNNTIKFGEGITLEDLTFERGNLFNF